MKYLLLFILTFISLLNPNTTLGYYSVAESSAYMSEFTKSQSVYDTRPIRLSKYLEGRKSPLKEKSQVLINYADLYALDWRLVPAISGVESGFGKNMPKNSYNAYGWSNGKSQFDNWEDSIRIVSKTLRLKYIDKGKNTIESIGKTYAPPSQTWSFKVSLLMKQIEPIPIEFTL